MSRPPAPIITKDVEIHALFAALKLARVLDKLGRRETNRVLAWLHDRVGHPEVTL